MRRIFRVYALAVGISAGIVEVIYSQCAEDVVRWLSENVSSRTIPGISGTMGVALLCSLLYDVPFSLVVWRLAVQCRRYVYLKVLAQEERGIREERERRVAEERVRQKQRKKDRQEEEKKMHREYELAVIALAKEMKNNQMHNEEPRENGQPPKTL